jgi:DNA-binding beta-propeller fold protein YncE
VDGPHGVAVDAAGGHYYVSIAHGTPYGSLWKLALADDRVVARTPLGAFPATVGVTPDGEYAFVSNFNVHGDHVPSSVSKVHLPTMAEVARTETCVMPHGSRLSPDGSRHYSTCMMDGTLVEIGVATGAVARTLALDAAAGEGHAEHGRCSPTWAQPSADGARVYVACNALAQVVEVEVSSWRETRRFDTGPSPYNLETTPDGRYLLVTLRSRAEPAVQVVDLRDGGTAARVPTSSVLPHGLAVTPDSRFAFVSVEGVGSEPGRVDVIDLGSLRRVATAEVGQQAAGIAVVPGR